jgi:hypothetical protein
MFPDLSGLTGNSLWRLSSPLKKTHMLRCAQSPRSNVLPKYAFAHRSFARLASEIFLSSLQTNFEEAYFGDHFYDVR